MRSRGVSSYAWTFSTLQVLGNIHSVLFGLDLIGNPSKLIGNIETGVKELIDESEKGFERHTRGSGVTGVAVGVKDLLGHVLGVLPRQCQSFGWKLVCSFYVEGSTESLGSTTGSFRNTLLETTDLDYKRVSYRWCGSLFGRGRGRGSLKLFVTTLYIETSATRTRSFRNSGS